MTTSSPLVSVVMPSLNQGRFIESAIASILGQDYEKLELIIEDGGSRDDTPSIIKRLSKQDSRIRWHSEPDTGPANAINKALSKARGTVIGWLNADDLYAKGAISRTVSSFESNPSFMMVYGQGQHIDETDKFISDYPTLPPSTPIEQFLQGCFICQPTVFFKRTMFVLLGNLDESLKTAFDFDYWIRAFKHFKNRIGFIDEVQAYSRLHKDCITINQRRQVALEGMTLLAKYLGVAPKEWLLTYAIDSLKQVKHIEEKDRLWLDVRSLRDEVMQFMSGKELIEMDRELDGLIKIVSPSPLSRQKNENGSSD